MRARSITVHFCLALPRGGTPWPNGTFPAQVALTMIRELPPDKRRHVFGRMFLERVGNVTGDPPCLLLSVENVELGAQIRVAERGTVGTHQFGDDAGPAEPTYAMFFDHNIVGIVRLPGGPPPDAVATYLEVVTGHALNLIPIQDPKVAERLDRPAGDFKKIRLTSVAGRSAQIARATKLGKIFEAAEEVSPGVEEITVILSMRTTTKAPRSRWWNGARPQIDSLLDDPETLRGMSEATVTADGEGAVDLLDELVTWKDKVPADERRHIDEHTIANTLINAYRNNEKRLLMALGPGV